ncbi:MAG: PEP-CTERM sorting domain-containing protein, partial [Planctomycetota bacterium]
CLALACATAPTAADQILITEVVTDPQLDHSDSAGGNGVAFDMQPGTGTVSATDEFIELFNAGCDSIDLDGYALEFADSSPTGYIFGVTTGGTLRFSTGSSINNLLPGGFVLLGNPPGSLNNAIDIEFTDPFGGLVTSISIEDGNASTALDEAVARAWTGAGFGSTYVREAVTPLGPTPTVPEPTTALLTGLILLGAAAARPRRARRGSGRTRAAAPRVRCRRP